MKLRIRRKRQKIARKTQKVDKVKMLMSTIDSQKRMGKNCPIQKTMTLQAEAYRTWDDSKHHFSVLSSPILVYQRRAASSRPAMFLVTQKSKLTNMAMTKKVDRY